MTPRPWTSIEDLPEGWRDHLVDEAMTGNITAWRAWYDEHVNTEVFRDFLEMLKREWAIETGVIEGVYALSGAATRVLVKHGIASQFLTAADTGNESPRDVIDKINDNSTVIEGLFQFIDGDRSLGTSYLKQLHQALSRHQPTYEGRDQFNNTVTLPLIGGEFKKTNNHVIRSDNTRFDYCPYEHVEAEIDRMLRLHAEHVACGVPAEVQAAWLHHRFSLIHPFPDGNGRVARCLMSLVLLRAGWLPVVVSRENKADYIKALVAADNGVLLPFVEFLRELQRATSRRAYSAEATFKAAAEATSDVLSRFRGKASAKRQERDRLAKALYKHCDVLIDSAFVRLQTIAQEVNSVVSEVDLTYTAFATKSDDLSRHFYRYQIAQCAKKMSYFANIPEYAAWARLVIKTRREVNVLVSLHAVGKGCTGVVDGIACVFEKAAKSGSSDASGDVGDVLSLVLEPLELTAAGATSSSAARFQPWLEKVVARGLEEWERGE